MRKITDLMCELMGVTKSTDGEVEMENGDTAVFRVGGLRCTASLCETGWRVIRVVVHDEVRKLITRQRKEMEAHPYYKEGSL